VSGSKCQGVKEGEGADTGVKVSRCQEEREDTNTRSVSRCQEKNTRDTDTGEERCGIGDT
jgi:hypothetical protein